MKFSLLLKLIGLCSLPAITFANVQPVPKFVKDDVVVFIGDSITHGGSYHKDIFLFHATRYPNKPFKYFNAGISGDTAAGTLVRFDQDVATHKPTKAIIMLGMNDVGGWLYQHVPKTPEEKRELQQQQQILRNGFRENMQSLANSLKHINSQIIFLTPSIYDQTQRIGTPNNVGRNDELALYAEDISYLAAKNNGSIVDFQSPMLAINRKWQRRDPSRTIVSQDRVHPGSQGHFLMAYTFLKAQGEKGKVADLAFNVGTQTIDKMDNCDLTGLVKFSDDGLSFACKPLALPFPLDTQQSAMLADIPFDKEMNQLLLTVEALQKGQYRLSIDGKTVGEYSSLQLSNGIDLSANTATPMYRQALLIKELNDLRAQVSGKLRNIQHVRFTMLSKYPETDLSNRALVKLVLTKHVDLSEGKPWHSYHKAVVESYLENVQNEKQLRNRVKSLFNKIYQKNQSQPLVWKLEKVSKN